MKHLTVRLGAREIHNSGGFRIFTVGGGGGVEGLRPEGQYAEASLFTYCVEYVYRSHDNHLKFCAVLSLDQLD